MLTWQQSDHSLTSQEIMINKNRIFNYYLLCKLGWHAFGHRRYFSHSKFIIYESLRVIRSEGPRAKSFIDSIFYLMMFLIEFFVRFRNREKNINYMERNLVHARGIIRTHECMLWSHTVCVCIATRRRIPLSTLKHLCSTFFFRCSLWEWCDIRRINPEILQQSAKTMHEYIIFFLRMENANDSHTNTSKPFTHSDRNSALAPAFIHDVDTLETQFLHTITSSDLLQNTYSIKHSSANWLQTIRTRTL